MKVLGWIIGIAVLLLGVGIFVALNSGGLVKSAMEEFGPEFLGVEVNVGQVNLALTEGSAQVKGLRIGNPQGFSGPDMLRLEEIKVVLDTNQIGSDLIVMKQVLVDGASVNAIAKGQRTNFQQLMDNLGATDGSMSQSSAGEDTTQMKFIIDRFDFTNAQTSFVSDLAGELELTLPDIHLRDIGRKSNGATAAELAEQVFEPLSAAVTREAVNQGLDIEGVKSNVRGRIQEKIGSELKGLTDRLNRE